MEQLLLWAQIHYCAIVFWAIIAVIILTFIFIFFVDCCRWEGLIEWLDYIIGTIFILGAITLLLNAFSATGHESRWLLYFALVIGVAAGFVNWRMVHLIDSPSLHPLTYGAAFFSAVSVSFFSCHWKMFAVLAFWSTLMLIALVAMNRIDKKAEKVF